MSHETDQRGQLLFYGGPELAFAPFALFLAGVAWLGLSGAPDERGFWPILLAALTLGMLLAKDRVHFSEVVIHGMSRPLVIIMILAWLLAGALGMVMQQSGFVEAMTWLAAEAGVEGGAYVVVAFLICCVVSTATGTSLGTLLVCGPLLYPAGGALGATPAILMGAIIGGATFGDNVSPISDTTIASALTQDADIAGVVRSRLRYALPAAGIALAAYAVLGSAEAGDVAAPELAANPLGLVMLAVPVIVVALLLSGHHLLEGLLFGILTSVVIGLVFGLIEPGALLYIDAERFAARGLLVEGMERGIGASIFTLLLMGLVAPLEASGMLDRIVAAAGGRAASPRAAEGWIVGVTTAVALITTHSTVALLTAGDFVRRTGETFGIARYRRANLMDITVCGLPFILPYMIPTILAASTSAAGEGFGMPRLTAFDVGLVNFHSWALLAVLAIAVVTGFGRDSSA